MVSRYHACSSAARRCDAPAKHRPWPGILFTWVLATFRATERSLGVNFKKWPKIGLQRVQNFDSFSSPGKVHGCARVNAGECSLLQTHMHYICRITCALNVHCNCITFSYLYTAFKLYVHNIVTEFATQWDFHFLRIIYVFNSICIRNRIQVYTAFPSACTLHSHLRVIFNVHFIYMHAAFAFRLHLKYICTWIPLA